MTDPLYNPRPFGSTWQGEADRFDTPQTQALYDFLETEANRRQRVVGLSIEDDGVFIYTNSSEWCDDAGAGTFRGDSESAAIRRFRELVQRAPQDEDEEFDPIAAGWERNGHEFDHNGERYAELTKAGQTLHWPTAKLSDFTPFREVQGMARDPIGYVDAIDSLLAVLASSNYADSSVPVGWLRPGDAQQHDGLYGDVWNALRRIAGQDFMDHLAETGEANIALAHR